MGFLFFDDSKHDKKGFSLGVFVHTESDPSTAVNQALQDCDLQPGIDEFKSSSFMSRNPAQAELREKLRGIIKRSCRLGVVVVPCSSNLGDQALLLLQKMLGHPDLDRRQHEVYFDEGLFKSAGQGRKAASALSLPEGCTLKLEQDSKQIAGIQLADLAAHTCAQMLKESLGLPHKTLKAGDSSGYDPDLDIGIGFSLWADIRYKFLSKEPPPPDEWGEDDLQPTASVLPYGLYISPTCGEQLRQRATDRFGSMYLGCIH